MLYAICYMHHLPVTLLFNSSAREAPPGPRSQKSPLRRPTGAHLAAPWRPKARFQSIFGRPKTTSKNSDFSARPKINENDQ